MYEIRDDFNIVVGTVYRP